MRTCARTRARTLWSEFWCCRFQESRVRRCRVQNRRSRGFTDFWGVKVTRLERGAGVVYVGEGRAAGYIVMACVVMAYVIMAYVVMAYVVMA